MLRQQLRDGRIVTLVALQKRERESERVRLEFGMATTFSLSPTRAIISNPSTTTTDYDSGTNLNMLLNVLLISAVAWKFLVAGLTIILLLVLLLMLLMLVLLMRRWKVVPLRL